MKTNKPTIKREDQGFYIQSESWYSDATKRPEWIDEITFGDYAENGTQGTYGEMKIVWVELGGRAVPQLRCFGDSWHVLATYKDVLDKLGERDGEDITPHEFAQLLKKSGFKDLTERDNPFGEKRKPPCPACGK